MALQGRNMRGTAHSTRGYSCVSALILKWSYTAGREAGRTLIAGSGFFRNTAFRPFSRKEVFSDLHQELLSGISRKEVFQPHLPVRLPCYDLAPITGFTLGRPSRSRTSGAPGFHGLTGGVYKARERIHRAMADARLLANPASWSRVADSSPNWEGIS